jgi:FtsP/CotA-like multicopper oxidase with cupredoxin domain
VFDQTSVHNIHLSGAFVVDAGGTKPDDRIFVLGLWSNGTTAETFQEILSINGKTWPYTERLTLKQGETLHWRVINPTASDHAMHSAIECCGVPALSQPAESVG